MTVYKAICLVPDTGIVCCEYRVSADTFREAVDVFRSELAARHSEAPNDNLRVTPVLEGVDDEFPLADGEKVRLVSYRAGRAGDPVA